MDGTAHAITDMLAQLKSPKVLISYRREECQGSAGWLNSLLEKRFGPENIFFDLDSIHPGRNYVEYLDEQASQCDVLLALIGPRWVTVENMWRWLGILRKV